MFVTSVQWMVLLELFCALLTPELGYSMSHVVDTIANEAMREIAADRGKIRRQRPCRSARTETEQQRK